MHADFISSEKILKGSLVQCLAHEQRYSKKQYEFDVSGALKQFVALS